MFGTNIWAGIIILRILTCTNGSIWNKSLDVSTAIVKDVKILTTITSKLYTYKANIIYFSSKTKHLLDYLDDMKSKRILIDINGSSPISFKPENNCKQLELMLDVLNTSKTFVCLNGIQLAYNKLTLPLQGPSQFTQVSRIIMFIDNFTDVHRFTKHILMHPNLIKIVYAANDCGLNEFELFKYYKCLWDINRILYVQYISHCEITRTSQFYNFTPFARNQFKNFDVFGSIMKQNLTHNIVVQMEFRNFNGYKLEVLFFPSTMAFLKSELNLAVFNREARHELFDNEIRDLDSFYGVDANVLRMWIKMNNFTVNTIPTSDGAFYGYRDEKGKFNGGLGDVIYKRVEFTANGYFVKDYETRLIEFSHAVISERLCLVVKTADLVPSSLILVRCFSPKVWISMVATLLVVGVTYAFLMQKSRVLFKIKETQSKEKRKVRFSNNRKAAVRNIFKNIEMMFRVMGLLLSAPIENIGHMQHERIFLTACFLWSLNISGAFQGSLVDVYTTPTSYPDIDTLDQLDKANYSIAVRHPGLIVDVFGSNRSGNTIGSLRSKLYPSEDSLLNAKIVKQGKLAGLERLTDFQIRSSEFIRNDGVSYLHLVKECPRGYLLSYLFPKSSIFLETINYDLNLLLQSGLISNWEKETVYLQKFAGALQHRKFLNPSRITLTLNHLQVAFIILGLGMAFSACIFLIEMIGSPRK